MQGEGGLTNYIFGERAIHRFCSNCGVSMFNKLQESKVDMLPINVRTLNGVDPKALNIEKGYMPEIVFKED